MSHIIELTFVINILSTCMYMLTILCAQFCHHWYSVGSETKISLYQMIFTDKVPCRNQQGTMYENLQSCCLRLEYALTPTPSTPNPSASVGSHVLRCFTVQHFRHGRGLDESNDGPSKYLCILQVFFFIQESNILSRKRLLFLVATRLCPHWSVVVGPNYHSAIFPPLKQFKPPLTIE